MADDSNSSAGEPSPATQGILTKLQAGETVSAAVVVQQVSKVRMLTVARALLQTVSGGKTVREKCEDIISPNFSGPPSEALAGEACGGAMVGPTE